MTARVRMILIGGALALLAMSAFWAQPTVELQQQPGKPPMAVLPAAPPPPTGAAGQVAVEGGPEPWYTLFATGEVVGYIEPCG